MEIGLGREEGERRVVVLGSDLILSELLHKFRARYHILHKNLIAQHNTTKHNPNF